MPSKTVTINLRRDIPLTLIAPAVILLISLLTGGIEPTDWSAAWGFFSGGLTMLFTLRSRAERAAR